MWWLGLDKATNERDEAGSTSQGRDSAIRGAKDAWYGVLVTILAQIKESASFQTATQPDNTAQRAETARLVGRLVPEPTQLEVSLPRFPHSLCVPVCSASQLSWELV
jgi:hypothetical protein